MSQTKTTLKILAIFLGIAILIGSNYLNYREGYTSGQLSVVIIPLDPKLDFGAKCDGKTDDTQQFRDATRIAARIGIKVAIPDNCVIKNFRVPAASENSTNR